MAGFTEVDEAFPLISPSFAAIFAWDDEHGLQRSL